MGKRRLNIDLPERARIEGKKVIIDLSPGPPTFLKPGILGDCNISVPSEGFFCHNPAVTFAPAANGGYLHIPVCIDCYNALKRANEEKASES